jgi:hypothetical protein
MKIWEPKSSGKLWTTPALLWETFTFTFAFQIALLLLSNFDVSKPEADGD